DSDGQYQRRRPQWPLLLDNDWKPLQRRPVRQEICAEQPYNAVTLGEGSERILSILEGTRVRFNVEVFRDDYETLRDYLRMHPRPSTDGQRRNYRKLDGFVSAYRRLYQQTKSVPVEIIEEWEQWSDRPGDGGFVPQSLPRTPWIRSQFFRGLNRRYHAKHFW